MQSDNKFKIILMAVFGFFVIAGLLAFSTFRSSNTSSSQPTIAIWGTVDKTAFDNFVGKYEQDSGSQFKYSYTEYPLASIDQAIVEGIATGKGPDAILIPQELIGRYLDKVSLIPFSSLSERTFLDTYIQEADLYIQPGGIFAIPFYVDPLVMYWNKDIFTNAEIAAPPASWSQFPVLAGKLTQTDNNGNITQSIAPLGGYANIDNAKAILSSLIMQAGGSIVSEDGTTGKLSSDLYQKPANAALIPAVAALTFYTDYSNPRKSVYSWNSSLPDSKEDFLAGNLAMYFGFASEALDIAAKNPNLSFDVAEMPQTVDAANSSAPKATFGELYGFAFLKSSPNTAAAVSLVSTLTSAPAVADFLGFVSGAPARTDMISAGVSDPKQQVFYDSAVIARGFIDPDMAATGQIFQSMVGDVTSGSLDADGAVQKASGKLTSIL
ncbi:MAG: extracellular solute-binding protein [Patescibacteria group bacterium]|nr:extracellular solute-binding protein [Patescibacteria group bacterium]MDE1946047.1 extracellular solute-binding protein [Patescibacteria group bacterium]